jgi:hypothetical protein
MELKHNRSAIAIEPVGFGIVRKHVCFTSCEVRGAVVSLQIDRPDLRPVVRFLGRDFLWSPLCACSSPEEVASFF